MSEESDFQGARQTGPGAPVDLARAADFSLGGLTISPSRLRAGDQRVERKVMEVLVALARHAGRTVTRDELIDACWGGRIVSDDAVNRVIAQVRALARAMDPPPYTLETIPRIGFRLAPAGGLTPATTVVDPIGPESDPTSAPLRSPRRRMFAVAAVAAVVLAAIAAGVIAWRVAAPPPSRPPDQNGRVDVVEFEPQSQDPVIRKAASQTAQSLVQILSGAGVQVTEQPVRRDDASGDTELRVAGTVEFDKGDIATTAQILDRKTGVVLWSDRLTQSPADQAASPGEIAGNIAFILHCALEDRKLAKRPISTEAFGLYLNACAGVDNDNPGRMLAVTRRLVKAAPDFASGHAMHAIAAARAAEDLPSTSSEAAALHAESKAAAERALALDPRTPKAYSGLALNEGALSNRHDQDWFQVERYALSALKLDPDLPPARNEYATMLRAVGRIREALEVLRTTDSRDPRVGGDPRVAMLSASTGDLAGAERQLKEIEAASRTSLDSVRWTIAFWWEDPKVALAKIDSLARTSRSKDETACYLSFLKELDARRASHARGLPAACAAAEPSWRVRMLAREGDVDGAFAALEQDPNLPPMMLYYPEMRSVRADPRFWRFAKKTGLSDYWRKSGHWPDFCAEPGLPFDCRKMAAAL